jgi:hypothetical protein
MIGPLILDEEGGLLLLTVSILYFHDKHFLLVNGDKIRCSIYLDWEGACTLKIIHPIVVILQTVLGKNQKWMKG